LRIMVNFAKSVPRMLKYTRKVTIMDFSSHITKDPSSRNYDSTKYSSDFRSSAESYSVKKTGTLDRRLSRVPKNHTAQKYRAVP
jgi:hypothetical protein